MAALSQSEPELVFPFPLDRAGLFQTWASPYFSVILHDASPATTEAFDAWMRSFLEANPSCAVYDPGAPPGVDPLSGIIVFERPGAWNAYVHIAFARRVWGRGFPDRACRRAIGEMFDREPVLTRVSAVMLACNAMARALAERVGFRFEGLWEDFVVQYGRPCAMAHYGLTRRHFCDLAPLARIESPEL